MPNCAMCEKKPARVLVAKIKENGRVMIYTNAAKNPLFCSKNCAANWALLWYENPFGSEPNYNSGSEDNADNDFEK